MSKNLDVYNFNGLNIRVVTIKEEVWFVARDVSEALGYSQTNAMNKLIDIEDKKKRTIQDGGNYENQSLINESGLYQAIFNSTLKEAKRFKRWVTSEVLPQIRKTGEYRSDWRKQRHAAASSFKPMMGMLQLTRADDDKATQSYHYANEAKLVNWALTGNYAAIDRDTLSPDMLDTLARLEVINTMLLGQKISRETRKLVLKEKAEDLLSVANIKLTIGESQ